MGKYKFLKAVITGSDSAEPNKRYHSGDIADPDSDPALAHWDGMLIQALIIRNVIEIIEDDAPLLDPSDTLITDEQTDIDTDSED